MKTSHTLKRAAWRAVPPGHPHPLHGWLTSRGSLTARIVARTDQFKLTRLMQRYRTANIDELGELGLRAKEKVLVRKVILWSGDMPLVFAHSIAGRHDLAGTWRSLRGLGTRPLAAMLFANPRVTRQPIEFQRIDKRHPLYREAVALFPTLPPSLWARRSVFLLKGRPLLVTEVFLPGLQTLRK